MTLTEMQDVNGEWFWTEDDTEPLPPDATDPVWDWENEDRLLAETPAEVLINEGPWSQP